MLCSKFAIARPRSGYVIVDDSPTPDGPMGETRPNPGFIVAAYGEGERAAALAHLGRLLDEEDADRAEMDAREEEERKAEEAQRVSEAGGPRVIQGNPYPFPGGR